MRKVELLAPAKNMKVIKAALPYTDSFYFGVQVFNMRMQADNFKEQDLPNVPNYLTPIVLSTLLHLSKLSFLLKSSNLIEKKEKNGIKQGFLFSLNKLQQRG